MLPFSGTHHLFRVSLSLSPSVHQRRPATSAVAQRTLNDEHHHHGSLSLQTHSKRPVTTPVRSFRRSSLLYSLLVGGVPKFNMYGPELGLGRARWLSSPAMRVRMTVRWWQIRDVKEVGVSTWRFVLRLTLWMLLS